MTDFGPNKTSSTRYLMITVIFVSALIGAFTVTVILLSTLPQLAELRHQLLHRVHHDPLVAKSSLTPTESTNHRSARRHDLSDERINFNSVITPVSDVIDSNHGSIDDELVNSTEHEPKHEPDLITIDYATHRPFDPLIGDDVIVETRTGYINGIKGRVFGKTINAFIGVPFAEPPINKLRFKKAVPIKPWTGTKLTKSPKPSCIQHLDLDIIKARTPTTFELSEDCLYMNIWTPADLPNNNRTRTGLRPIMIWIYGGGYSGGSNSLDEFDGRVLAAHGDVVVITITYRNGALGFLDLGSNEAPGNQGLSDNLVAINWIKQNAQLFGGDPDEITLFGQSAGAISIGLLMVNDHTSKLFKRAVMQSGSPIMLNFFFSRTEETAINFLKSINCSKEQLAKEHSTSNSSEASSSSSDTEEMFENEDDVLEENFAMSNDLEDNLKDDAISDDDVMTCLRSKSSEEIIAAQKPLLEKAFPFTPSPLDTELLPLMASDAVRLEPTDAMYNSTFSNTQQVLMGVNRDEASVILLMEIPEIFGYDQIRLNITTLDELKELLIANFSKEFDIDAHKAHLFANMFFSDGPEVDTTENLVRRLYNVIGDLAFTCPVTTLASALAKRGKEVFTYEFAHRAAASPWAPWMGVPHGDEYLFVFGYPLRYPLRFSGDDISVSKRMMSTWAHFARTGKMLDQLGTRWPQFSHDGQEYMTIESRDAKVGSKLHDEVCGLFRLGFDSFRRRRRRQLTGTLFNQLYS